MEQIQGIVEILPRGEGQVRPIMLGLPSRRSDPLISRDMIRQYSLREGAFVRAEVSEEGENGKRTRQKRVSRIIDICGLAPEDWRDLTPFEEKTVIDPQPQIVLEPKQDNLEIPYGNISVRAIDLICPLGFGQRAVIVAPPRSGKTILLQQIAIAIKNNFPDIELIVLLIDERPEEVTEMRTIIPGKVFASCNDRSVDAHVRLGRIIINYGKSLAQSGKDVVILLDSLTRLARAYNIFQRGSGKIMSGGIDAQALQEPKRLFGSARNFEQGGSLTIISTALIDTGSRMDELIFREFKGTGNMELVLSRKLANQRIFPAIDIEQSGTRKEHLLVGNYIAQYNALKKHLLKMDQMQAMKSLINVLNKFPSNNQLLKSLV